MENVTNKKVLESIQKVYERAEGCGLENVFFDTIKVDLDTISSYFGTSDRQTFFIAIIFVLNYKGSNADLDNLVRYFDCNHLKMLEYNDDFEYLRTKGIILKRRTTRHLFSLVGSSQFFVREEITEALLQNQPMPEICEKKTESIIDLLEELYNLTDQREDANTPSLGIFQDVERLILDNTHFQLIEKIKQFGFSTEDTYLFLYMVWKTIIENKSTDIENVLDSIYSKRSKKLEETRKIIAGDHALIKNNLIEITEAGFFQDREVKLTYNSIELLNECDDIKHFVNKSNISKKDDIIDLLEELYNLSNRRENGKTSNLEMIRNVEKLIANNMHFPLIEKIKQFDFSTEDTYLFVCVIWKTLSGRESTDIQRILNKIYNKQSQKLEEMQKFMLGEHILIKNNLVEITEASFFSDTGAKLTPTSIKLINECGIKFFLKKKKRQHYRSLRGCLP